VKEGRGMRNDRDVERQTNIQIKGRERQKDNRTKRKIRKARKRGRDKHR